MDSQGLRISELDADELLSQVGKIHLNDMVDPNYVSGGFDSEEVSAGKEVMWQYVSQGLKPSELSSALYAALRAAVLKRAFFHGAACSAAEAVPHQS